MTPTLVAAKAAEAAVSESARIRKQKRNFLMLSNSSLKETVSPLFLLAKKEKGPAINRNSRRRPYFLWASLPSLARRNKKFPN
jgi:hypothetical protein